MIDNDVAELLNHRYNVNVNNGEKKNAIAGCYAFCLHLLGQLVVKRVK